MITPSQLNASMPRMGRQTFSEFTGGITGSMPGMTGSMTGPVAGSIAGASGMHQLGDRAETDDEPNFIFEEPSNRAIIFTLIALFVASLIFWLWAAPKL
jgi:hypothetical protein